MQEVVGLHELVGEFGERHPFAFAVEAFLYRIFGHHVVHGNQLADVADEIQEGDSLHPVVVVHQHRRVGSVRFEIEQLGELFLDRLLVVAEGLFIEQVALLRFAAGVADHARRAAHQSDGGYGDTLVHDGDAELGLDIFARAHAIGRCPHIWKCLRIITLTKCPMCSESAVGSMPT